MPYNACQAYKCTIHRQKTGGDKVYEQMLRRIVYFWRMKPVVMGRQTTRHNKRKGKGSNVECGGRA